MILGIIFTPLLFATAVLIIRRIAIEVIVLHIVLAILISLVISPMMLIISLLTLGI